MSEYISRLNSISYNQFLDQEIRPFQNPICKQTYESLPRIYGNKKAVKYKNKYKNIQPKYNRLDYFSGAKYSSTPDHYRGVSRYLFPSMTRKNKYNDIYFTKSIRAATEGDHYRQSQHRSQDSGSKTSNKVYLKPIDNQVKTFSLSDLQTPQKVQIFVGQNKPSKNQSYELHKLLNQSQQKQSALSQQLKPLAPSRNNDKKIKKSPFNGSYTQVKNSNQAISKKLLTSFDLIQQQNQQQNPEPSTKLKKIKKQLHPKSESFSQNNGRQKSAISLSRYVFSQKHDLTMFKSLQKIGQSRLRSARKSITNSVLSSGVFRIPQQQQYKKYILRYKSMNPNFDLIQLVKKKHFKVIRDNKSVYFGQVNQKDERHGLGLAISQKEIFQGQYQNNLRSIGYQRNIDGTYIGGYKNGVRSGEGEFRWNNGQTFRGNWQNGMKNGFGVWKAPQGHFYQGQWYQNRQHGTGVFKHHTSTYKGQFYNFLKQGHGQQVFMNGDKYEGQYKEGRPDGKGKYQWSSGGTYQGQFKQGKRQGYGVWIDSDGTKYSGQFKDDAKDGHGTQIYKTGEKFVGIFSQGCKKNGKLYNKKNQQIQIVIN